MKHQPFENWILDDDLELSQEQVSALKKHLEDCSYCQELDKNWQAATMLLVTRPILSPSSGFSLRWQDQFVAKRLLQQKKQVRKTFLFVFLGIFTTSILLMLYLALTADLAHTLVTLTKGIINLSFSFIKVAQVVKPFLNSLPTVIPVSAWMFLTTTFVTLTFAWFVAVWQFAFKGVYNQ
ncbi:MAG: hypothetical protein IT308_00390 [Anaerolineaceae bacterium]|nr:hypothetical protein [Anaerolineaceae bacterium]